MKDSGNGRGSEVLGYVLTAEQIQELQEIDLLVCPSRLASSTLVIETGRSERMGDLVASLQGLGGNVEHEWIQSIPFWRKDEGGDKKGIVPNEALERIVDWLSKSCV